MATDRRLSADFWLHEFPGWRSATEAQVDELRPTVQLVLQPLRSAMGVPVIPSSWIAWSDGTPRTGAHAHAGTVDFTVAHGLTRDAWEWGKTTLVPGGYIGRWIYEPERAGPRPPGQGEHVHMAPRIAMLEVFGEGDVQVLEETTEGVYALAFSPAAGAGLVALILGAVALLLARGRELVAW